MKRKKHEIKYKSSHFFFLLILLFFNIELNMFIQSNNLPTELLILRVNKFIHIFNDICQKQIQKE
jgi:hypothetical protein